MQTIQSIIAQIEAGETTILNCQDRDEARRTKSNILSELYKQRQRNRKKLGIPDMEYPPIFSSITANLGDGTYVVVLRFQRPEDIKRKQYIVTVKPNTVEDGRRIVK